MPPGESGLIDSFFRELTAPRPDVVLGIGDDAAVLAPPPGCELLASTDTLVEGVHFLPGTAPRDLGWKSLAVNLSDIAAMGGDPCWALLSLTLPAAEPAWLRDFCTGFADLARRFNVHLAGGNLAAGPLNITVQILGTVPAGKALRRDRAQPGDSIFVSGSLGGPTLALRYLQQGRPRGEIEAACLGRLLRPTPRVSLGRQLRGIAACAIDLSDGLASDLGHVLAASGTGAEVELARLPLPASLQEIEPPERWRLALAGGDDYELCFTVPAAQAAAVQSLRDETGINPTCIGRITAHAGLRWLEADGNEFRADWTGYRHF